jgi:hypothetical protein
MLHKLSFEIRAVPALTAGLVLWCGCVGFLPLSAGNSLLIVPGNGTGTPLGTSRQRPPASRKLIHVI